MTAFEVDDNASITTRKYKAKWTAFEVDDNNASITTRKLSAKLADFEVDVRNSSITRKSENYVEENSQQSGQILK